MAIPLRPSAGPDVIFLGTFILFVVLCAMLCFQVVKQGHISILSCAGPQKDHFGKNLASLILWWPWKLMQFWYFVIFFAQIPAADRCWANPSGVNRSPVRCCLGSPVLLQTFCCWGSKCAHLQQLVSSHECCSVPKLPQCWGETWPGIE